VRVPNVAGQTFQAVRNDQDPDSESVASTIQKIARKVLQRPEPAVQKLQILNDDHIRHTLRRRESAYPSNLLLPTQPLPNQRYPINRYPPNPSSKPQQRPRHH